MSTAAPNPPIDEPTKSRPEDTQAAYATEAIPAGIDAATFLSDPVTDQLVRVVMELGAGLWVERRRTRTLERVLERSGILASGALEQWVDEPADAEMDNKELEQWMKRIYGPLAKIGPTEQRMGADQ